MRRKRGKRCYWFPPLGQEANAAANPEFLSVRASPLVIPPDGTTATNVYELTFDEPHDEVSNPQTTSLADMVGSGYVLNRFVGKLFVALRQEDFLDAPRLKPTGALITAGLFVARTEQDQPYPVGAASDITQYSPLIAENAREPWIWRRTWALSNNVGTPQDLEEAWSQFPPTNCTFYGSGVFDGPHIDSKIKRRIVGDDRLWLAISSCKLPIDPAVTFQEAGEGLFTLDYRLLGSLTRPTRKGTF